MGCLIILLLLSSGCNYSYSVVIIKSKSSDKPIDKFFDNEANFGPDLSFDIPVVGYVFPSDPPDGCSHIIPVPKNHTRYDLPFICLIKRGNCSFESKVRAANAGGFQAAIVYNNESDSIFIMSPHTPQPVLIPSVMIGLSDGNRLLRRYIRPMGAYVIEIYANENKNIEVYLIPVLCMFGMFIVGMFCMCLFRWHERHSRRRRRCLTFKQLQTLPQYNFNKLEATVSTCVICLEEYEDGDQVRKLPCDHVYHAKCIEPWLLRGRRVCPICKRVVFPGALEGRSFLDRFHHSSSSHSSSLSSDDQEGVDTIQSRLLHRNRSDSNVVENHRLSSPEEDILPPSYGTVATRTRPQQPPPPAVPSHTECTPLLVQSKDELGEKPSSSDPKHSSLPHINLSHVAIGTQDALLHSAGMGCPTTTITATQNTVGKCLLNRRQSTPNPSESLDSPYSQSTSISSSHRSEPTVTLFDPIMATSENGDTTDIANIMDRVEVLVHSSSSPPATAAGSPTPDELA